MWNALPFGFIVAALLLLLTVPALVDRRTSTLRTEIIERLDPASWEAAELGSELSRQPTALVSFTETGDSDHLAVYTEARMREAEIVGRLRHTVDGLGPAIEGSLEAYLTSIERWHAVQDSLLAGSLAPGAYADRLPEQLALMDTVIESGSRFRGVLREVTRAHRVAIARVERLALASTAVLAVLALGAAIVVHRLERRRRRLATELRRYADEETILAGVAGALGGAWRREEVLERVVEGAVAITRAFGAYIERAHRSRDVEVVATAGLGVPPIGTRAPYPGSLSEEILEARHPALIHEVDEIGESMAPYLRDRCHACTGLVVPLISEGELLGALVLLRGPRQPPFRKAEAGRARTLGDLGTVALRRIMIQEHTERERRERTAMLESTTDGVYVIDRDGRCTFINRAGAELLGYRPEELIGRRLHETIHHSRPDGSPYPRAECPILRVLEERRPLRSDDEVYWRKDGSPLPIEYTSSPIIEDDEVQGAVIAFRDATQRRRAEAERAELLQRERAARAEAERRASEEVALREATEAVAAHFTVEEVIQQIAESAVTATGSTGSIVERIDIEPDEVVVVSGTGVTTPLVGTRVPFEGSLAEYVIERGREEVVLDLSRPGHPVPDHILERFDAGSALVVPLLDAGEAIGALFLIRGPGQAPFSIDEAARARTFANLAALAFRKVHLLEDSERRREELERVMESRSRLMRGFSHDVKNPLGAADGHAQLLAEGVLGELESDQREGVERIRASIRSALDLIDDLLELARAEAGQISVRNQPTDLSEVARELGETYRSQAEAAGIELRIEHPGQLPVIESDVDRVRQILGNLLSNAVKYSSEGDRVDIVVDHRTDGDAPRPGEWVTVSVRDTGPGIPKEKLELLFQEFTRLDQVGASGAGLGLAISRNIARLLDGEITAESEVGKGSVFTLWLPRSADAETGSGHGGPAVAGR